MSYPERKIRTTSELHLAAKLGVFCEEKILLMANYGAAAEKYCASVAKLEQGMIRGSRETYAELRRSVEIARIICEAALKELDDHVSAHSC
jgi:hypothetical protein